MTLTGTTSGAYESRFVPALSAASYEHQLHRNAIIFGVKFSLEFSIYITPPPLF